MIRKSFIYANAVLMLALCSETGYSAELNPATGSAPTQIVVQNVLAKTASGVKHVAIRLIARDGADLHENQVYQAQFINPNTSRPQDGHYDVADEVLYIPRLHQRGLATQQTTLRLINRRTMEFAVMETNYISSGLNTFDPSSIHDVKGKPDR